MNEIDWIIIIILVFSGMISLMRGFVKEALSLVSWLLAFIVSLSFSGNLAHLMSGWFANETLRVIAAFICLFFLTLIVTGIISSLLSSLLSKAGLGVIDRLLGTVFGVLRGSVIVLAVLIAVQPFIDVNSQDWWRNSQMIPHFLKMENWAKDTFTDINQWRVGAIKDAAANTLSK